MAGCWYAYICCYYHEGIDWHGTIGNLGDKRQETGAVRYALREGEHWRVNVLDMLEPEMTAVHGPLLHGTVLVLCRVAGSPPWLAA